MSRNKKQIPRNKQRSRIKVDDQVIVISGEGRIGKTPRKVIGVLPREGKVLVEGVRVVKDTPQKGSNQNNPNPQDFIEKPMPIAVSNVSLVDSKSKGPTRIRMQRDANGNKSRVAVKSGEAL